MRMVLPRKWSAIDCPVASCGVSAAMMMAHDQTPRSISVLRPTMLPLHSLFSSQSNQKLSRLATERNLGRWSLFLAPELFFARIKAERVVLRQHVEPIREAKHLGCVYRPIGIAQHLARDRDDVGLAVPEDRLRVRGLSDHADNGGRHSHLAAHMLGIDDVIARQIARHRRQAGVSFEPAA